jgi:hypothetical protein
VYASEVKHSIALTPIVVLVLASLAVGSENKPLTFDLTSMGESEDKEATEAGFHTSHFRITHLGFRIYEASDGERVSSHSGDFTRAGGARLYFDWILKNRAAQVVRQNDKSDRDGNIVGRRAEYMAKSEAKTKIWIVMWTDGDFFRSIEAPTLESALALEKGAGK